MNKVEFEQGVGREITPEEFKVIDIVYSYHPAIASNGDEAKKQVISLYLMFGMVVFYDMIVRAEKTFDCEMRIREHKHKVAVFQKELDGLGKGRCV